MKTGKSIVKRIWKPGLHKRWKYLLGWMMPHQALLVKRELFIKYGGFDIQFEIAADYDWMLRVFYLNREPVKYCNFDVITMEIGGKSNASFKNIVMSNLEVLMSWKKYFRFIPFWIFVLKPVSKIFQIKF